MAKIYTKRGDMGKTEIYRKGRRAQFYKNDPLYHLLGKLDEAAVWIGKIAVIDNCSYYNITDADATVFEQNNGDTITISEIYQKRLWISNGNGDSDIPVIPQKHRAYLRVLQQVIIGISTAIQRPGEPVVTTVEWMETLIDELTAELPPLTQFLLTVSSPADGICQTARTIVREAERCAVEYYTKNHDYRWVRNTTEPILCFLNRLSDYLFTLGRYVTTQTGTEVVSDPGIIAEFGEQYMNSQNENA